MSKTEIKKRDMMKMMGATTFEATAQGLHFEVWLTSQEEHKKLMDGEMGQRMMGMKDKVKMDTATMKAMMAGTHHLMLHITNAANGLELDNINPKVDIETPSKQSSTVDLKATLMNHFGSGITLDEKGDYKFTINLNDGDVLKTTHFVYSVKYTLHGNILRF
jgi:hypothetical protein